MPENEFEKKISTEMQELRFKPPETVWMKVEERIRKKKKRRVFIILFLLAGISLLGYWQWDNFFGNKPDDDVNAEIAARGKDGIVNKNDQDDNQVMKPDEKLQETKIEVNNETGDDKKIINKEISTTEIDDSVPKLSSSGKKSGRKGTVLPIEDITRATRNEKVNRNRNKVVLLTEGDQAILTTEDPIIKKDTIGIKNGDAKNVNQELKQKINPTDTTDSIKPDTVITKEEIKKDSTVKKADSASKAIRHDSAVVITPPGPQNKKWKLGIEFNPGVSSLNNTFFSFSMNKSADMAYQTPSGGSGSGSAVPPASPAERRAGFAFQLGGFAKKQLSHRSGLSFGFRYVYYTDHISIGARRLNFSNTLSQFLDMQGANRAFGAAGDSLQFANRYHFVELPVYYSLRLNKNESYPLIFQAGLKFGRMVGSNALVYDTVAGGIYYRSDKYFNKTQVGFSVSLNWTAVNKPEFQWTLGPVIDIHFRSLLNSPFEDKNYLLFTGIRTSIIFHPGK